MPTSLIDGIETRYELVGDGPPLLMFSPGGFDATRQKWSSLGVYGRTKLLEQLARHYRCIVFDRRETGESGGRIERITWDGYARQGAGLLDHLGIDRAFLMGGCMGCAPVVAFAAAHEKRVAGMILYWPVGGARYRINAQQRFAQHLAFVHENGLQAVVDLARASSKSFGEDPRAGPWVSVLRRDAAFAESFARQEAEHYRVAVLGTQRALFDRDTAPGAEPESLLRLAIPTLVVPGRDASHATSAARYLEECLPGAEYWDMAPEAQTETNAPARVLAFLDSLPRL
jgi:pimeloyl-ACP methyl ester carboxylesterase